MNEKPKDPSNKHLKIVPQESVTPEERIRRMTEETEHEMGSGTRYTAYNIDDIVFEKDPQKNNNVKIKLLEDMLKGETFDSLEEHDIAKKLIELKGRKF